VTPTRVVIGIGNPFRGDDGIGPALIAELAELALPDSVLRVSTGDPFDLIAAWAGADHVVVVDAAHTGQVPPGTIHHWERRQAAQVARTQVGSHGLGLPDAIAISDALGLTPAELVILAVEIGDVRFGTTLSPEVARALLELGTQFAGRAPSADGASARR